jgi:hypothetical protein
MCSRFCVSIEAPYRVRGALGETRAISNAQQTQFLYIFVQFFPRLRVVVGLAIDSVIRKLDIENSFWWNARECSMMLLGMK